MDIQHEHNLLESHRQYEAVHGQSQGQRGVEVGRLRESPRRFPTGSCGKCPGRVGFLRALDPMFVGGQFLGLTTGYSFGAIRAAGSFRNSAGPRNPLNKSGTTAILCWNRAWLRRGLGQSNNLFRGFLVLIGRLGGNPRTGQGGQSKEKPWIAIN